MHEIPPCCRTYGGPCKCYYQSSRSPRNNFFTPQLISRRADIQHYCRWQYDFLESTDVTYIKRITHRKKIINIVKTAYTAASYIRHFISRKLIYSGYRVVRDSADLQSCTGVATTPPPPPPVRLRLQLSSHLPGARPVRLHDRLLTRSDLCCLASRDLVVTFRLRAGSAHRRVTSVLMRAASVELRRQEQTVLTHLTTWRAVMAHSLPRGCKSGGL